MSSQRYWRITLEPESGVWGFCREKEIIAIGYPDSPDDINVRRFRDEMKVGDKVAVYLLKKRIGALGTVTGDYCYDEITLHGHYCRTRKVQWDHKSFYGWDFFNELSDEIKDILKQRNTIQELKKEQYEEIEKLILSF
jgi:predicted Mrr-cat superfamily restriction endonuclease